SGRGMLMNRIVVEPEYLYQLFYTSAGPWRDELSRVWQELKNWEYPLNGANPRAVIVAEALEKCHAEAIRLLQAYCPEWLEERCYAIQSVGRLYGYGDFTSTVADAVASLHPCKVSAHGTHGGQPVTLPDQCAPTMVLGFYQLRKYSEDGHSL